MTQPVRVSYFISSFVQGGAERQLAELIKGLDRARFTPSLIVCEPVDQLGEYMGVHQRRLDTGIPCGRHRGAAQHAQQLRELLGQLGGTVHRLRHLVGQWLHCWFPSSSTAPSVPTKSV